MVQGLKGSRVPGGNEKYSEFMSSRFYGTRIFADTSDLEYRHRISLKTTEGLNMVSKKE